MDRTIGWGADRAKHHGVKKKRRRRVYVKGEAKPQREADAELEAEKAAMKHRAFQAQMIRIRAHKEWRDPTLHARDR